MKHFHGWYQREHGGQRSYTWVKKVLQAHGAVVRAKPRGKHRKRRERAPLPGMLVHQDASTHLWVPDQYWALVVTLDDATGEHLSMFFCEQEGTLSSLQGVSETIARHGLFCALYTDRGRHYFHTPEAGVRHASTAPAAGAGQDGDHGDDQRQCVPASARSAPAQRGVHGASSTGRQRVCGPHGGRSVRDVEQYERVVGQDNCVRFEGMALQIPADGLRHHDIKRRVRVHRHLGRSLSLFYGPRRLGRYDAQGAWMMP